MLQVPTSNLLRLRESEAATLSVYLDSEDNLADFQDAIRVVLSKFNVPTVAVAEEIYAFGRQMRQVFDNRSSSELKFKLDPTGLNARTVAIFYFGFLRQKFSDAETIVHGPSSVVPQATRILLDMLSISQTR